MSSSRLFYKAKLALSFLKPRYYVNMRCDYHFLNSRYAFKAYCFKNSKSISNYSSMKTKDTDSTNCNKNSDEQIRKILEDEDFQNILKDFAKDFEVDNDSKEVLEDIRKNLEQEEQTSSNDKHCSRNDIATVDPDKDFQKYKAFSDDDSSVILSYEDQYECSDDVPSYHIDHELKPKVFNYNIKRGITGVFDIDELIPVLRSENLIDITTISIPKEYHYADYLVLATARSERHCIAVVEFLLKLYKQKKNKKDPFLKTEGENVPNWKVIDMGNIVLHVFLEETRALYDIESLWLLDANFDSGGNIPEDPALKIIEEQLAFFNSMNQSTTDQPEIPKSPS